MLALAKYGNRLDVTNSYLGIITQRGLETLVLETEHAALFLFRRLARPGYAESTAFWAVLDEKAATDIVRHIRQGRTNEAFRQFNIRALDLGTLLPPLQEE